MTDPLRNRSHPTHGCRTSGGAWFGTDPGVSALLALSGVLTGGPLILFSYAARRIGMAQLGLIQYLNATLQVLCAAIVF